MLHTVVVRVFAVRLLEDSERSKSVSILFACRSPLNCLNMRSLLMQLRTRDVYLVSCRHLIFILMLKMLSLWWTFAKNLIGFESETSSLSSKSLSCFADYVMHHRGLLISFLIRIVLQRHVVGVQMLLERSPRIVELSHGHQPLTDGKQFWASCCNTYKLTVS